MSVSRPTRVAAETLRGDVQAADVVDYEFDASTRSTELRYLVDFGTHREWVSADEVEPRSPTK